MNGHSLRNPTGAATGAALHLVRAVPVHMDPVRRASTEPRNVEELAAHSNAKAGLNREATHLRKSGLDVRTHTGVAIRRQRSRMQLERSTLD